MLKNFLIVILKLEQNRTYILIKRIKEIIEKATKVAIQFKLLSYNI